jgi:hypothetical protein
MHNIGREWVMADAVVCVLEELGIKPDRKWIFHLMY